MCPSMLRVLWSIYRHNYLQVRWENSFSRKFEMKNGVKQGGKSSPKKFTLYIDELFNQLQSPGYGCSIHGEFVGVLGYTDDLALLAASKSNLTKMLKICSEFAEEVELLFNPSKSVYMVFNGKTVVEESVTFNNLLVKSVTVTNYLGHKITFGSIDFEHVWGSI